MEQYEIYRTSYFEIIQRVVKTYKPEAIFIRFIGSRGGGVVGDEDLTNKVLELKKVTGGFKVFIDGEEKFFYRTTGNRSHGRCWAVA